MRISRSAAAAAGVAVAALAVSAAGNAAAASAQAHAAGKVYTLKLDSTLVGPLLTAENGFTAYMFTKDKHNRDMCKAIKKCEIDWPPLTTSGKVVAGPGVNQSLIGTIPYQGTLREITYAGHPLHTYKFDNAPGSSMNIGNKQFGGGWFALTASAAIVK